MKLHHLTESIEPNALLSLQNIVSRGGRHRNTFELIVLARFLQLLKDGQFYREANPIFTASISTDKTLLDLLRGMSDEMLAQAALKTLNMVSGANCADCVNPQQSYLDWINLYTAREATD